MTVRGVRRRPKGATPTPDLVARVYREVLGREPAPEEVEHQLANAGSIEELLDGVFASEEHRRRRLTADAAGRGDTRAFAAGLRCLHDTLAATALGERYWIWGGLLIGWAREGWPLAHDSADADFCFRREDMDRFEEGARALFAAGFAPLYRFRNNAGRVTEFSFEREGAKFEFFVMDPDGDRLRYYDLSDGRSGGEPTEAAASVRAQPLVTIDLVGRTWRKHADHDEELTAMYGDWRTPDSGWWFMDDRAIEQREPWARARDLDWSGELDEERV